MTTKTGLTVFVTLPQFGPTLFHSFYYTHITELESKAFHLIKSLPLTDRLDSLSQ